MLLLTRLLAAIHVVRPDLTLLSSAVVEAIVLAQGSIGTAESVALRLGLRNRFELARRLERDGLPSLHCLAEWITVLSWVSTTERTHVSLCWMAFRSHRHPSACYRMIKRVTGRRWEDVQIRGFTWLMQEFLRYVRTYARRKRQRQSPGRLHAAHPYGVGSPAPAARSSRIVHHAPARVTPSFSQ